MQLQELRSMVDQLHDRSLNQNLSNSRIKKNPSHLESPSRMLETHLTDQNMNGKESFLNMAAFEGFERENAHNLKELKILIEQIKKNQQNNSELLNKLEVETMSTKSFREIIKKDISELQSRLKTAAPFSMIDSNLALKPQSMSRFEIDSNSSRDIGQVLIFANYFVSHSSSQINNMLLSHYNNLIALNNKVSELSEYHKINDVKDQLDVIRRANKYEIP